MPRGSRPWRFAAVDSPEELHAALRRFGAPLLLKTRRGGYDGKGQAWVQRHDEAETALTSLGGAPGHRRGAGGLPRARWR